ncbi:hypothetical protein HMPREF0578_2321 [Mobiluncus mulieris 28-1]|uniref:hypothetical protein n=1 Tax=Mobiluncus mulieris TaxID=2052 RepID=UPI0001BE7E78|nr:hypothetical protein [Mobiluncus mulieris]EEZ91240.1 hypothetical protein HMPREF0578_2321 [Mobiluncus mulieris 28-1]
MIGERHDEDQKDESQPQDRRQADIQGTPDADGRRVADGFDRPLLVSPNASSTPGTTPQVGESDSSRTSDTDSATAVAQILSIVQENHLQLHLPLALPDVDKVAQLRERAPELYQEYIYGIRKSTDNDTYERRSKFSIPARYAACGQFLGFFAVIAVLGLSAYAMSMGAQWLAGILGVIDIAAVAAVFGANQKPKER